MGVQFGGLASGLDTNGIIDGLMKAERIPLDRLKTRQTSLNASVQTMTSFSNKLATLKAAAEALGTADKFSSFSVTSSDTAVVGSVSGVAAAGSYSVAVNALAKEQRTYSVAQASGSDPLGMAGTLSLTVGSGAAVNVTIDASDSLSGIAAKIAASGARVTTGVVYDGSSYRLQVRGMDSGAANAITFGESGFSLGLSTPANTVQAAQDSEMTIDGITVRRPTNQVVGVLPGITFALTKPTSAADITIAPDATQLQSKMNAFISAYNDVVSAGQTAAGYGSTKAQTDELAGDATIRSTLGRLGAAFSAPIAGVSGKYTSLAAVGLTTTRDGKLTFDSTKMQAALATDPTNVAKLFVVDSGLGASGVMGSIKSLVADLTSDSTSLIQARITGLGTINTRVGKDIADMELRMTKVEERLRSQFTQLEQRMSAYQAQLSALGAVSNLNLGGSTNNSGNSG